jgi:coenzyme PQQ precursor peptide PqqA
LVRCNLNVHVAEIALSCSTFESQSLSQEHGMAWMTPVLVEICIGMEINAYAPAEF